MHSGDGTTVFRSLRSRDNLRLALVTMRCPMEIVFSVQQESDGGFVAECLSHDIFVQADDWDGLRAQVLDAVAGYFFDTDKPSSVRLHFVRDELLAVA